MHSMYCVVVYIIFYLFMNSNDVSQERDGTSGLGDDFTAADGGDSMMESVSSGSAESGVPASDGLGAGVLEADSNEGGTFKLGSLGAADGAVGGSKPEAGGMSVGDEMGGEGAVEQSDGRPSMVNGDLSSQAEQIPRGFIYFVKTVLGAVFKKPLLFFGLTILFFVVMGVLAVVSALLMGLSLMLGPIVSGFLFIFVAVLFVFMAFLFNGTIANQATSVFLGTGVSLGDSFKATARNFFKAIALTWKIFVFSGIWVIFLVLAGFALSNTVLGGMGPRFSFVDSAFQYIAEVPVTFAQGGSGLVGKASPTQLVEATGGGGSSRGLILTIVNFGLGFLVFLMIFVALIRMIYASLAFPILFARPEISAKEALDYSKVATKKKWWLIVSYLIVFSFLLGLIPAVVGVLGELMDLTTVAVIISGIFSVFTFPLMAMFWQVLALELGNSAHVYRASGWLIALTVLLFLLPGIVGSVAPMILLSRLGQPGTSDYGVDSNYNFDLGDEEFGLGLVGNEGEDFDVVDDDGGDEGGALSEDGGDEILVPVARVKRI